MQCALPQVFPGASAAPALQEEAAISPAEASNASFVSAEELATLSPSQVAFLERKRRAAAGLGPVMPAGSSCERCAGVGTCVCSQCSGAGVNSGGVIEEKFQVRVLGPFFGVLAVSRTSATPCAQLRLPRPSSPLRLAQNERGEVRLNNGVIDMTWFMVEGAPCWLCRGRCDMGCPDCAGTGIKGGVGRFTGD